MTNVSYKGKEILKGNEPDVNKDDILSICLYVINEAKDSFLEFLLYKEKDSLELLKFKYEGSVPSKEGNVILNSIFNEFDEEIKYVGYIDNILFYEMYIDYGYISYKRQNDKLWLVLVDEIVNKKKSLNFDIDNRVVNMFLRNKSLLFLLDKNNKILPSPIVVYYGNHYNKILSVSIFGVPKASVKASHGPFYYYSGFDTALRYAIWTYDYKSYSINDKLIADKKGKYNKGGIVKFAIFTDKCNISSNIDKSEWVNDYDSIIYYKSDKINYAINKYSKQLPLSYYSINTDTVNSMNDLYKIKIE